MNSMTGFGRAEGLIGAYLTSFEIKSVNHRFLDCRFRLPSSLTHLEMQFNEFLKSHFERGSFEIVVKQRLNSTQNLNSSTKFVVDENAAKSLYNGFDWIKREFKLDAPVPLESFLQSGKVFLAVDEGSETSTPWEVVKPVFEKAVDQLKQMRKSEGEKLKGVFLSSLKEIEQNQKKLVGFADVQTKGIKEKLMQRLSSWNLKESIDATRLEWEVALLAEKSDITEELDRLSMHVQEFNATLQSPKSIGRKLDFLTQELHREVNTMSSKASLIEITKMAVELKGIVEKLREQVQNVE